MLGFKHTKETIKKMKGRKNALGFTHNSETLKILSENQKYKKHSLESKAKMRENWVQRKISKLNKNLLVIDNKKPKKGKLIIVTNLEDNTITQYISKRIILLLNMFLLMKLH